MSTIRDARSDRGTRTEVDVPAGDQGFHVSNLEIERIFFEARNAYLGAIEIDDLWHQPVIPQVRELTTRFDAEVTGGTALTCTTRVVSRSRRAFVMEQALVDSARATLSATCRSVHVTVGEEGAVEIPDDLWASIELYDGGPIPNLDTSHGQPAG